VTTMKRMPCVTTIVLAAASAVALHAQALRTDTAWHSTIGTRAVPEISQHGRVVSYHPPSSSGEVDSTVLTYEMGPAPSN